MKKKSKLPLILIVTGAVGIVTLAISAAFMTGEKAPLYASGTVEITPELEASARGFKTLYLVALPSGGGRMPLGAARFNVAEDAKGRFLEFTLTPQTMQMMPGAAGSGMPETFKVKARLDADGAGGMDQPGDLVGEIPEVRLGSKDLKITINRAVAISTGMAE